MQLLDNSGRFQCIVNAVNQSFADHGFFVACVRMRTYSKKD